MVIKSFEDYIKEPDFIKNADPEAFHVNILNPHSAPPTGTHAVGGAECGLQHSGWPAT